MKKLISMLVLLCLITLISGCVGIGVVKTSNPYQKLNDAEHLFTKQDRPLLVEGLIIEAIEKFKADNDLLGAGHAYRTYGDFLRSKAVRNHAHIYEKLGFQDKSITMSNRLIKSVEKLNTAMDYYRLAEPQLISEQKFDRLSNLYFNIAWTKFRIGGADEAEFICNNLYKAKQAYRDNVNQNPDATPEASLGFKTFEDQINYDLKQFKCETAS